MAASLICYLCYNDEGPGSDALARAVNGTMDAALARPAQPLGTGGLQATMAGNAGNLISLMAMPVAFPADELTDDLAQRQAWPNWRADSKAWRSHIIAMVMGFGDTLPATRERAGNLLQLVAAAASQTGASGVGWSATALFHPTASFAAMVARAPVPVDCVVRCVWRGQPRPAEPGMGLKTVGLGTFSLPEIDHPPTGEDPVTVYNRVMNLSTYLMDNGSVLKDGDTIGADAHASMRIQHDRSPQGALQLALHPVSSHPT